jgi:hypothetical protein
MLFLCRAHIKIFFESGFYVRYATVFISVSIRMGWKTVYIFHRNFAIGEDASQSLLYTNYASFLVINIDLTTFWLSVQKVGHVPKQLEIKP